MTAVNNPQLTPKKDSPGSEFSEPDAKKADQETQDRREKLMRQHEVSKTYQPLKESKAPTSAPKVSSREKSSSDNVPMRSRIDPHLKKIGARDSPASAKAAPRQANEETVKSNSGQKGVHERPFIEDEPRRDQQRERTRDFDKRDNDRDTRRSSMSQAYSKSSEYKREDDAYRQKMTEENSRRAAEYKRDLEAQGFPVRQVTAQNSKSGKEEQKSAREARLAQASTSNTARKDSARPSAANNRQAPHGDSDEGRPDSNTIVPSPKTQIIHVDSDINDWLELTDYYNIEMREKRLRLFRKKKALEIERAELEREELELQGFPLVARAQSVLPASASPMFTRSTIATNVKMPPPPLPLITANNDVGIKIKDTALSAGLPPSQSSTPTNKRQHAEDEIEERRAQPAEKIARTDVNGNAPNEKPLIKKMLIDMGFDRDPEVGLQNSGVGAEVHYVDVIPMTTLQSTAPDILTKTWAE
ncbi:hypothetical protein P7C71_g3125, partial [Lecanoromycetidae sp. Uapishka_2]